MWHIGRLFRWKEKNNNNNIVSKYSRFPLSVPMYTKIFKTTLKCVFLNLRVV
jgi:membrane-anchored protein YejM (alkaline phosphatase superfamily)